MNQLEYIREIGCEMENAFHSAVIQAMTDGTIHNYHHCILQRNFIASKLNDFEFFAKKLDALLHDDDNLATLRSIKATKSHEEAFADLLQCVENLEASEGKKSIAFVRELKGENPSEDAVQRRLFHRIRDSVDFPSEKTLIVYGSFTQEESFGRYVDLRSIYTNYRSIFTSLKSKIQLTVEENERMDIPSYIHFIAQIESHLDNFPHRIKCGAFTSCDASRPEEVAYLKSDFAPRFAAYLHEIGDLCKMNHLKVYPLDIELLQEEKEAFPSKLVEVNAEKMNYIDETSDKKLISADFLCAAEKRALFWINRLQDRIRATTRMFERRQIITPEEVDAEETREELNFKHSLSNVQVPPWAYILPEKVPIKPVKCFLQTVDSETPPAESGAQLENAIPLWLRKINGLNVRLFCQVCNQTYAGPTIFEQHFKEFRHTQSLSRLGIINIPAMHGVDSIDEAKKLWIKIIDLRKRKRIFWTSEDMEFENELGEISTGRKEVTM